MEIEKSSLDGVLILTPKRFGDARGYFSETFNGPALAGSGVDIPFVQDNESMSAPVGTLRGLHFQRPPRAQDKLVRVASGVIFDVAVDIRHGSPTFGKWVGVELSHENGKQLLVPKGFAHGFVTRVPNTTVIYKCSDTYAPETEGAIHFADPDLGIDWGIAQGEATVSDKDGVAPAFAGLLSGFDYKE